MSEAVIVALIAGGLSLVGTIITVLVSNRQTSKDLSNKLEQDSKLSDAKLDAKLEKHQAVTETKLEELTREVRKHNNFAERVPVLEEQIRVANHRIADLEKR